MKSGTLFGVLLVRFGAFASVIWFLSTSATPVPRDVAWKVVAGVLTYLGTYAGDYLSFLRSKKTANPIDISLFKELMELMPPGKTISTCRMGWGATFKYKYVKSIMEFADYWDEVDKRFIDSSLEALRKEAHLKALKLAQDVGQYTVAKDPEGNLLTTKLGGRIEQPPQVYEEAKIIQRSAMEFADCFEKVIAYGRKHLSAG